MQPYTRFDPILFGLVLEVVQGILLHGRETVLLKVVGELVACLPWHRKDPVLDILLRETER